MIFRIFLDFKLLMSIMPVHPHHFTSFFMFFKVKLCLPMDLGGLLLHVLQCLHLTGGKSKGNKLGKMTIHGISMGNLYQM